MKTIREIYRMLKPGGYFVLTVEIFEKKVLRDPAHPRNFTKQEVYKLLEGQRFDRLFERESPWIRLCVYVKGQRIGKTKELIIVLRKCE